MNTQLKIAFIASLIAVAYTATAIAPTAGLDVMATTKIHKPSTTIKKGATPTLKVEKAKYAVTDASNLKAEFSVLGQADANVATWTENFDNGAEGWTLGGTAYTTWTTKQIAAPGNAKSFSNIDPNDVQSLYVEGDYREYNREITYSTSPEFTVPANATLEAWVGYSLNFDNYCRLIISASDDNFATSTDLWNSGSPTEPNKTWIWHSVSASLDAFEGKSIKLRFTYTFGTEDNFGTGGYMGDFAIDGIKVNGKQSIDHIDVQTGETVTFMDITDGEVATRQWILPGATPSESTAKQPEVYYTEDGAYDVTLIVTDAAGNSSTTTRTAFVNVTGTAPMAAIGAPATFRSTSTYKYMVAPAVPVTFTDVSGGFPTESRWVFGGVSEDSNGIIEIDGKEATVAYHYQHDWPVGLTTKNIHGTSSALADVSAEFEGFVWNLLEDDKPVVSDVWEGEGRFPGSAPASRKITAYGERFSAPSAPVWIPGAMVYFEDVQAEELIDQITPVTVSLYTADEDGFPEKKLDSASWSVLDLDRSSYVNFEFTSHPVVDGPFIITVEGIPDFREATADKGQTLVTFGMAKFRSEGGTAIWRKDGKWQSISDYFPAGQNHTSFVITPYIAHSILTTNPIDDSREILVGAAAGTVKKGIYSLYGCDTPKVDADWVRVTRENTDMTVQDAIISFDALPGGETARTAHISFTDGASTMVWTLTQSAESGIDVTVSDADNALTCTPSIVDDTLTIRSTTAHKVNIYDVAGHLVAEVALTDDAATVDTSGWNGGTYIVSASGLPSVKIIKR